MSLRWFGATIGFVALMSLTLAIGKTANAVEAPIQNVTITPSSSAVTIDAGDSKTGTFDIINGGTNDYNLKITAAPYHVEGTDYDPQFTPLAGTTDASKWVTFDNGPSKLLAHKLANYTYTIRVPAGTAPGGYYAVLFAETSPVTTPTNGVVSHSRVGDILYITVNGAVKTSGSLESSGDVPRVVTSDNLELGLLVKNSGGVHFVTKTQVTVTDLFHKQVFAATFERYVLPQTARKITTQWQGLPTIGIYKIARSATVAGKQQTLPDIWILVVRPWIPLVLVIVLFTIIAIKLTTRQRHRR